VTIALMAKKLGFVDGSCRKPMKGSPMLHQWERCNAIVLSWIMNTVSKEIFAGIIYSIDAFSVWKDLKERFNKVNGSRIYALHREIVCSTQGNLYLVITQG
ncbi:UBN2_3 domain-containing protein, partial [Cephalotus follicularis]